METQISYVLMLYSKEMFKLLNIIQEESNKNPESLRTQSFETFNISP